jgi:hypothetical protein
MPAFRVGRSALASTTAAVSATPELDNTFVTDLKAVGPMVGVACILQKTICVVRCVTYHTPAGNVAEQA